ncbi:MAG: apolipoprotein N-acyltransferase [Candidatus Omnitrophota bacterium]
MLSLSAALLSLAFSSFNFYFFAWIGLVPLFFALEDKNKLQAFLLSYACGFLFFAFSMYWLIHVSIIGWVVLSLYQAIYFGAFGLLHSHHVTKSQSHQSASTIDHRPLTIDYLALSSAWVLLEYLRAHLFGGIGWNLLGYSQYQNLPIIQIADIAGVWGVSFLVILLNITVYNVIKMAINCYRADSNFKIKTGTFKQELKNHPTAQVLVVVILFALSLAYGYSVLGTIKTTGHPSADSLFKISVIQGNIPQKQKWDERFQKNIMDTYEELTLQASKDEPQLIIWPETAVPGYLNYEEGLMQWLKRVVNNSQTQVLVGAPVVGENNIETLYNSALLFSKEFKLIEQYNKLHLVALGEFVPFEKQFPWLRKFFPITGAFSSGKEYTIFNLQTIDHRPLTIDFSTLICYEDIFPGLVRQFVKKGANFMVNMTNDAWFGKTCAAYQHGACSVLRAVENRTSFVRSANTGLSCFIDKTGRIYDKVSKNGRDLFVSGIKTANVPIFKAERPSIYTKYGDIFILICLFLSALGLAAKKVLTK